MDVSAVANYDDTNMTVNGSRYLRNYASDGVVKFHHKGKQSPFLDVKLYCMEQSNYWEANNA